MGQHFDSRLRFKLRNEAGGFIGDSDSLVGQTGEKKISCWRCREICPTGELELEYFHI